MCGNKNEKAIMSGKPIVKPIVMIKPIIPQNQEFFPFPFASFAIKKPTYTLIASTYGRKQRGATVRAMSAGLKASYKKILARANRNPNTMKVPATANFVICFQVRGTATSDIENPFISISSSTARLGLQSNQSLLALINPSFDCGPRYGEYAYSTLHSGQRITNY